MDGGEFSWGGVLTKCFASVIKSAPETISQFVCGAKRFSSEAKAQLQCAFNVGAKVPTPDLKTDTLISTAQLRGFAPVSNVEKVVRLK